MKKHITLIFCILCLFSAMAAAENPPKKKTDANITGHVTDKNTGEYLPGISIYLKNTTIGTPTDATGHYSLKNLPIGDFILVMESIGYKTIEKPVKIEQGKTIEIPFSAEEDVVALSTVVVTANRNETAHQLAPTLVNVVTPKIFEMTNSQTLSQGIVFQPGVRVENNCQNCGYTQVRINGMDGKYTQILIDSRPILSSLAGVYGLEQIPSNMVERVEVVRGGGSALFGSSAIAGTLNIITKEPTHNSSSLAHTISKFGGSNSYDNNTTINLSFVSDNSKTGTYIYGQNRFRSAWDQNADGFSELPKLKNQTIGFNAYYRINSYSKIKIEYHHIEEFRRGGSGLNLPPHIAENEDLNGMDEAGIVEQIRHSINTGGIKYDIFSKNQKHQFNVYASAQHIDRESYYGAYGTTTDFTGVAGTQYIYHFDYCLFMPADLTGGIEFNHDALLDRATDIQKYRDAALEENPTATGDILQELINKYTPKPLDQTINVASVYAQNEWKNDTWSFLLGGRIDKNSIMKKTIFSPRANIRYNPLKDISIRLSYAEGFRAPQAFDEDLHISKIGGDLRSIELDKDLKEERSRSVNGSIDMYHIFGKVHTNLLIEGFYTKLLNSFVLTAPIKDPNGSGYLIQTRTNGSTAQVYGTTIEGQIVWRNKIHFQTGITLQRSLFDKVEEWSADEEHLSEAERYSNKILRTPNVYGYFTASYTPVKSLTIALNGNYTGKMYIPHLLSEVDNSADILVRSPNFFELGTKATYEIDLSDGMCFQFNIGIQNMFNSYQTDFDKGANRDSGYMYGPGAPRTYFAGIKINF